MVFKHKTFTELTTRELYEILKSRCEVFLLEQKIICQDMDDVDYDSHHFFLEEDGRVIAYLRAYFIDDKKTAMKIGRVISLTHKSGLGRKLFNESLGVIKETLNCKKLIVSAQKQALGFYEKMGFTVTSGEYLEEGIIHLEMEREI